MKLLSAFFFFILVSSCCGTNQIAQVGPTITVDPLIISVEDVKGKLSSTVENSIEASKEIDQIEGVQSDTVQVNQIEAFNHQAWNALLKKYVDAEGHVDYKGFNTDRALLKNYISKLGENMPNSNWTKEDKLAYWINAYNAMTVDLIIRNYPLKSIRDIDKPWDQRLWKLGDKWFNLDEIEHQILRKMNEPRIHFGIVCASYSCPKLLNEAYTSTKIEAQLTQSTRDFLSDSKRNSISENELNLSKIFQWFAKDFKSDGTLIEFLNTYSDIKISSNAKKKFKDYNWDLNE